MSRIIDRALDIIGDHLKTQTSELPPTLEVKPGMAKGGRLLEDDYPTHYMPHVGRQVMADGGEPDPVSQALSTASEVQGDAPIPAPTPRIPAPGAEGSVGRSKTLGESFANIPEGAPWAARSEEPANTPTIKSLAESFTNAIQNHASLPYKERVANTRAAIEKLAPYIGTRKDGKPIPLFGKNAKLMKSEKGYKGEKPVELEDGMGVETTGLALAPAFKMGNFNTCPNSASCKDECLGKTSGNYFALGGGQDLSEFKGPRLNSLNKTIAMIQEPEAFAVRLYDEIMSAKREAEYNGNHLGVRLNVLSDLHPSIHKALFEAHPDVDFYDYTKNNTDPVAPNHHYTYSSTGASQEGVDNPFSNWDRMRRRLDTGSNVAMAFSHKKHLPTEVHDEETGKTYKVINGDTHDFRPLDKVAEGEEGVIIGLKNKKGPSTNANAHIESNGFFVKYDPQEQMEGTGSKRKAVKDEDGDTIPTNFRAVIPVQKKRGKLT
jgi:hypothetical protein